MSRAVSEHAGRLSRAQILGRVGQELDVRGLRAEIRAATLSSGRKVVVLDDDPTGVQTVHDVDVLTTWDIPALSNALQRPEPLFYVLTNSRALDRAAAVRLAQEAAANLEAASHCTGVPVDVISRGDSTLRGHYPWEIEPLYHLVGGDGPHGVLIVPAFPEGGRFTLAGTHFVSIGDDLVPVSETDFARDPSFAFSHSYLPDWIEEKTGGQCIARDVLLVPLGLLREGNVEAVTAILLRAAGARPVVADCAGYCDLTVLVAALLRAEAGGRHFICRTAASFVKARAALEDRPLLKAGELFTASAGGPGLVLVGSYVQRSSEQLARVLERGELDAREMAVERLLEDDRDTYVAELATWIDERLACGHSSMLYTSRTLVTRSAGMDHFAISAAVSQSMAAIVAIVRNRPSWIIAKGGITASDVATHGLGVRRARVLGQVATGVPVWRLGAESRLPGMPYVVFPGNVGSPSTLAEVISALQSADGKEGT